ncbi:hypothetical protein [Bosea sp. BK604]|uniref:hypothetical protein n=1 Tax=Bosea sp. BK604 TaxID=2512180 RepID=UPI00104E724C|nr:hypothetical protein [Bosea sp. BK604]TCR64795.1 hypothetical protein EV560_106262 [Bosea sp. BK604]
MRTILVAGMMMAAGAAAAVDFGVELSIAQDALFASSRPPLRVVECNTLRCIYQTHSKDITLSLGFNDEKTVVTFYVFYRPSNWAIAADYIEQIQAALRVPRAEIVNVRELAEAGKDRRSGSANSKTVACRTDGDGLTPTIVCTRA